MATKKAKKPKRKQQTGFFWHLHHGTLCEWCRSYDERVRCIRRAKPKYQMATRLRLFKPVRGRIPKAVRSALMAFQKAERNYDIAAYGIATRKASAAYNKADAAYWQALRKHKPELEALHAKECGCKEWNGTEIVFPKR